MKSVDLYQIHGPVSLRPVEVLGEALAEAVKLGLVKYTFFFLLTGSFTLSK